MGDQVMKEKIVLLDPTSEITSSMRERLPRTVPIQEAVIGLLDISKPRGDVFLDELERLLGQKGMQVKRFKKPTFTRTAPLDLLQEIRSQCNVVVEALAD
jgi:hypothetical protein